MIGLADILHAHRPSEDPFYTSGPIVRWVQKCTCGTIVRPTEWEAHVLRVLSETHAIVPRTSLGASKFGDSVYFNSRFLELDETDLEVGRCE